MRIKTFTAAAIAAAAAAAAAAIPVAGAGASTKLKPPVIKEPFTPLPCSGKPGNRTTLQQEGCVEKKILAGDAKIDALSKSIFNHLADDAARKRFITGANAWLYYRRADCNSRSDQYEGGSQAVVVYGQCEADRNVTRIGDLNAFLKVLMPM